ncbi:MAG TPA: hypothetical protein VLJ39_21890 [Tepidisphaeraceae bacterium]|nr:hypothetical protein [Tepidisphaeraceae bacterium]
MNHSAFIHVLQRRAGPAFVLMALMLMLAGCPHENPDAATHQRPSIAGGAVLQSADLSDPIRPSASSRPIDLRSARNEWTSFSLEVSGVESDRPVFLRLGSLQTPAGESIAAANLRAYQILPMPVEVNPGYVRHTGLNSANRSIPRALLAVAIVDGKINLAWLRDPTDPTNPARHPRGATVLLWIDVHVPPYVAAGDYTTRCELIDGTGATSGAPLPVKLTVYDFTLPDARHLQMAGGIDWDRLAAIYPGTFGGTITPNLISRADPRYRKTIATLDQLMALGQEHRASLVIPALRPTVKWPAGRPPEIDWREFDALIRPWMRGDPFADGVPIRYWPLPAAGSLQRYDLQSRLDYWKQAATHFDQLGWLDRSPVWLRPQTTGPLDSAGMDDLSAEAGRILAAHERIRVAVPLQDSQLAGRPGPTAGDADRLLTAGAALVSSAPTPALNPQVLQRTHWMQTDLPGLVPYAGAGGDERDVRVWAWLAFLRHADLIVWDHVLPSVDSPNVPADPNALTWFYPGQWFGVPEPVPTIQLEWLRRAQQDYEYLWLAAQRGEVINALQMARLITKPLEIEPGQAADPVYSLLSGTPGQAAWDRAQQLLAATILLRQPGKPVDAARQRALYIETLQWAQPQERPQLIPREAKWKVTGTEKDAHGRSTGNWLALQFSLDVFNAADATPDNNLLQWSPPPPLTGWEMHPQPVPIPRLQAYHVLPVSLSARFDLNKITPDAGKPIELSFINGYTRIPYPLHVRLPVAASERREGPITLDGKLSDWSDADSLQDGPLVRMMSRPDLQKQELQPAATAAKIYSTWGAENFYLGFSLDGLSAAPHEAHNEVYYQARRAWGEDLCEVLIQPLYADNSHGPVLHVVCKPNGAQWVERKSGSTEFGDAWRTAEGAGIRYATTTADSQWRGEMAIPWNLINSTEKGFPVLLRFNFSQHRHETCESASWCGPVDFGRDEALMGVLYLRQAAEEPTIRRP